MDFGFFPFKACRETRSSLGQLQIFEGDGDPYWIMLGMWGDQKSGTVGSLPHDLARQKRRPLPEAAGGAGRFSILSSNPTGWRPFMLYEHVAQFMAISMEHMMINRSVDSWAFPSMFREIQIDLARLISKIFKAPELPRTFGSLISCRFWSNPTM